MALDRFVYWRDKCPSPMQIKAALIHYMGGVGELEDKGHTIIVHIPGGVNHVPERLADPDYEWSEKDKRTRPSKRWFEVFIAEDDRNIDIITRQMDEFTNALADGFLSLTARLWDGSVDVDSMP